MSGKKRIIFWIVVALVFVLVSYAMFLAFDPIIGNSLVTALVIVLVYVVGILGAWRKFKRWGWF